MTLLAGSRLGPYEIVAPIGAGVIPSAARDPELEAVPCGSSTGFLVATLLGMAG